MIEVVKKYNVLEIEDVERLVSEKAGRDVKIDEMDVALVDCIPMDAQDESQLDAFSMFCEISVDGEEVLDDECFGPLDGYLPAGVYVDEKYIFAFDTSLFNSYERYTDSSD